MADLNPIRVFAQDGKWLVDYGSYAHGYHTTRREAVETARRAARDEHRDFVVDAKRGTPITQAVEEFDGSPAGNSGPAGSGSWASETTFPASESSASGNIRGL